MSEYGVEFEDPKVEKDLHTMDKLICTFQGNDDTVMKVIELISTNFELIKCHKRECKWMAKGKEVTS